MQSNHITYGFSLGSASRILYSLKNIDCCYTVYPNNIDHYLNMLLHDQPRYILGLGSYSDENQNQIRIETKFSNQFRNDYIVGNSYQELVIQPFLNPGPQMKQADTVDNSYHNLVSWKIVQLINEQLSGSHYTFLRIPQTMRSKTASQIVDMALLKFYSKDRFESEVR